MKTGTIWFILFIALTGCRISKTQQDKKTSTLDVILGKQSPETAAGEYLEYTIGGDAGSAIAKYMDKQIKDLKKEIKDGSIERIGEGIYITFGKESAFAKNSAELTDTMKKNIEGFVKAVRDYDETDIIVEGHSDTTGNSETNLRLAAKRARAVADYAISKGLDRFRMVIISYGEDQSKSKKKKKKTNLLSDRRVEIAIVANRRLKALAKRGDIN
jgi:outer membrane protein OmpA-like peptidoglycan-associated protein